MPKKTRLFTPRQYGYALIVLCLAAVYVGTAKFGFTLAFQAAQVTVVWPPTGIALAAMLLLGRRFWPGVFLGAFLANITTHEPFLTACCIAAGNTLEALSGAWMLTRLGFNTRLCRIKDIFSLVVCSAVISTGVSATIGVASLCLGGTQPWTSYSVLWLQWWLGDASGALVVAPLFLAWARPPHLRAKHIGEALALAVMLLAASLAAFEVFPGTHVSDYSLKYIVFPFVIWGALRFGQHGTTLVTFALAAVAVWATAYEHAPFHLVSTGQQLMMLQIYLMVASATGLFLSASIAERRRAERIAEEEKIKAEQATSAKSEFLANMSHEIRTPLNSIIGIGELLEMTALSPDQHKYVEVLTEASDMLLSLVNNVLDFSKIESGAIQIERTPVALLELLEEVRRIAAAPARQHGLVLDIACAENVPATLLGDPMRLKQVLLNLTGNAVKFSDHGTVSVHVKLLQQTADQAWLRFSVEDSGKGIPPEKLEAIFEKFTQLDEFATKKHAGTGLGLAICRNLVEKMGGSIHVTSEVGKGSLFWFDLPLTVIGATAPSREKIDLSQFHGRVLLVEDSPANRLVAQTMLETMGCTVDVAHNGHEALQYLESGSYDVIFMDCQMPEMDGFQTTAEIRRREQNAHTTIIAMTANVLKGDRERCLQAGMDDYVGKPLRTAELGQMLSRYLMAVAA